MRARRLIVALGMFLVGIVWVGQGVGLIGGSFMTNVGAYAVLGAALMLGAFVVVVRELRGTPRP